MTAKPEIVETAYGWYELEIDSRPWPTVDEDGFVDNDGVFSGKVIRKLSLEEVRRHLYENQAD